MCFSCARELARPRASGGPFFATKPELRPHLDGGRRGSRRGYRATSLWGHPNGTPGTKRSTSKPSATVTQGSPPVSQSKARAIRMAATGAERISESPRPPPAPASTRSTAATPTLSLSCRPRPFLRSSGSDPSRDATGAGPMLGKPPTRRGRQRRRPFLSKPTERDRYRTEESCQQDSRKHENLQRNLILAHVPFST